MFFVNGNARELVLVHDAQHLFEFSVDRQRNDAVARCHDLTDGIVGEFDQALDGILLELLKVTFMAAGFDDVFQLFRRMAAADMTGAQAENAQQECGGALDCDDERLGDAVKNEEHGRNQYRETIGLLDGEIFGNDFADDDVGVADDEEGDRERKAMQQDRGGVQV